MLGTIPFFGVLFQSIGRLGCWFFSQPPEAVVVISKATCSAIFGGCQ